MQSHQLGVVNPADLGGDSVNAVAAAAAGETR